MFHAGDQIENPVTGERLVFHETAAETMSADHVVWKRDRDHGQATMDGPELLVAEMDLDDINKARRSLPWWRDRRPDLYGNLDPP